MTLIKLIYELITGSRKRLTRKAKPLKKRPRLGRVQRNGPLEFPEVKGKVIEAVKLYVHDDASIFIFFADKTHLRFDFEPGLTVRTDLSDWKSHNWRPIKSWPRRRSVSAWKDLGWGAFLCPTAPTKKGLGLRSRRRRKAEERDVLSNPTFCCEAQNQYGELLRKQWGTLARSLRQRVMSFLKGAAWRTRLGETKKG